MEQVLASKVDTKCYTQMRAPQVLPRSVLTQKRTNQMLQVDQQVSKIARIFREREQTYQLLEQSVTKATTQLSYICKLTLEERHRSARLATSTEQSKETLCTLKEQIRILGDEQLDPLNKDFERVRLTAEAKKALASEIETDISYVTHMLRSLCQDPLATLKEHMQLMKSAQLKQLQEIQEKRKEADRLREHLHSKSMSLDALLSDNLNVKTMLEESAQDVRDLQAAVAEAEALLTSNMQKYAEIKAWNDAEQKKRDNELEESKASVLRAKEESLIWESEIEIARLNKSTLLNNVKSSQARAEDQRTRCDELLSRVEELTARADGIRGEVADLTAQSDRLQTERCALEQEQRAARARVEAVQETTAALTESIARQQELMTDTVRQHDDRQAQQSKLYEALQARKDSQRAATLQHSQRTKDMLSELQRAKCSSMHQSNTLATLQAEAHIAEQNRSAQQRATDAAQLAAAEATAALKAQLEARAQDHAESLSKELANQKKRILQQAQQVEALQRAEEDSRDKIQALSNASFSPEDIIRLLPDLQNELDHIIAEEVKQQKETLEEAFLAETATQRAALDDIRSGKRLEREYTSRKAGAKQLQSKIDDAMSAVRALGQGDCAAASSALRQECSSMEMRRLHSSPCEDDMLYAADGAALKVLETDTVQNRLIQSAVQTPVFSKHNVKAFASPDDWFTDADLW